MLGKLRSSPKFAGAATNLHTAARAVSSSSTARSGRASRNTCRRKARVRHEQRTNDYRFEHPLARRVQNRACLSAAGRRVHWAAGHLPGYRERVSQIDSVNLAFMRAVLQVSGASVFGDTSKRLVRLVHLMRLPEIDIRLVLLVRDVRGYAASAKRRGFPVFDAARTWQKDQVVFAAIARGLPAAQVHRLRYEDLCASPQATLGALWAFCGVPTSRHPSPWTRHSTMCWGTRCAWAGKSGSVWIKAGENASTATRPSASRDRR